MNKKKDKHKACIANHDIFIQGKECNECYQIQTCFNKILERMKEKKIIYFRERRLNRIQKISVKYKKKGKKV